MVYTDNDPIVLKHAEALLRSTPEGATDYVQADVREPGRILKGARETLDLARPVALSLVALTHFLGAEDDPHTLVAGLVDALPSGSYLVLSQLTADFAPEAVARGVEMYRAAWASPWRPAPARRSPASSRGSSRSSRGWSS